MYTRVVLMKDVIKHSNLKCLKYKNVKKFRFNYRRELGMYEQKVLLQKQELQRLNGLDLLDVIHQSIKITMRHRYLYKMDTHFFNRRKI